MKKNILLFVFSILFSQIVNADSLDIKIGQMLMVGMSGTSVNNNSTIIKDVEAGIVGGVLLFEYNLNPSNTQTNVLKLTEKLQDAATIKLLISIDQEGGKVNRLKTKYGFKAMPSAQSVGDKKSDEYAIEVSATIANALADCGINLNFAPVADIYNPLCPVLGKINRCFSANPLDVAHYDSIYIQSHHAMGIKTSLKHFPGHGSSRTDSHLGLVDVSKYWNQEELLPYQVLINEGIVDMIMTAHIVNRKLDESGMPATLSYKIITELLREKMNYHGVIISDDMQMHAISSHYGLKESLKIGILAGVDMFIFSNNIQGASQYTPTNIHSTIRNMVDNGEISESRINESYERIIAMKRSR